MLKHGHTVTTPKLSGSHHSGKYHYHRNPRRHAKLSLRQRWCLSHYVHYNGTAQSQTMHLHFHYECSELWTTKKMVVWHMEDSRWHCTGAHTLDPSCAAVVARKDIPQVCQPPYSQDMVPCAFFLFSWIRNTLKGEQFEDIKTIKLKVTSRDA